MSTYTNLNYHIVFATKNRKRCLIKSNRERLYKYIWGILKNKKCRLFRINGVEDHLHILASLHPTCSISDLLRDIKTNSNSFIKENNLFPGFDAWQEGYAALTHNSGEVSRLIDYIKNQEEHHKHISSIEELKNLLKEQGIEFDERYLK